MSSLEKSGKFLDIRHIYFKHNLAALIMHVCQQLHRPTVKPQYDFHGKQETKCTAQPTFSEIAVIAKTFQFPIPSFTFLRQFWFTF